MSTSAVSVLLATVLVSAVVCVVSAQSTGSYGFQAVLTSYTGGAGTAHVYLDATASVLVVAAQWAGLTGPPTNMHIHGCLPAPASLFNSSGVIISLAATIPQYGFGTTGEVLTTFDLSQTSTYGWGSSDTAANQQKAFLNCLLNGTTYYNIHTTAWPAGELSGIFQQTTQVNASWTALTASAGIVVPTTATGNTTLLYNANTHEVFISAGFQGLTSNSTGVHWHGCAASVGNATKNYIIKLNAPNAISQISASFVTYYNLLNTSYLDPGFANLTGYSPLTAEQTIWTCLVNGSTTFNVHSVSNPGGELTGWFSIAHPIQPIAASPSALTTYTAILGAYTTKGGAGSPVGYATVTLDVNNQLAQADVTIFSPLTAAPTASHVHGCTSTSARYPFSTAGIMVPLNPNTLSTTGEFQNVFSTSSSSTYYDQFLQSNGFTQWYQAETAVYNCLQNEQTYVNIHTPLNPAGEASGVLTPSNQVVQLLVPKFTPYNASVPATATASAYLVWDMAAHLLWVNVTYSGLTGSLIAAHIHGCLPKTSIAIPLDIGANSGLIVQSINTAATTSYNSAFYTAGAAWPPAWYAEQALARCFYNNSLYINLHTLNFPAGEVQGSISLDANNVVPSTAPHTTAISAAVQFTLSLSSLLMPATVAVLALIKGF